MWIDGISVSVVLRPPDIGKLGFTDSSLPRESVEMAVIEAPELFDLFFVVDDCLH